MPSTVQIGRRVTQEGELRLLLRDEGAPDSQTLDFSVFEWLSLIAVMSSKLRDYMAEITGQAKPPPPKHDPKSDILIAHNVTPLRSKKRGQ